MDFHIGQSALAVLTDIGSSDFVRPVVVETIGYKWVHCRHDKTLYKVDPLDGAIYDRDECQIGMIYPDRQAYDEAKHRSIYLARLRRAFSGYNAIPGSVSAADILESARLLGLDISSD
tara:strand:- start:1562 stop:1915 length:354 start_codon:yes stop_codon:yes gene_type:complete